MKPERDIYELMAKRLNVLTRELLLIDDKEENIEGAVAAGACGVLFEGVAQLLAQLKRYGVPVD